MGELDTRCARPSELLRYVADDGLVKFLEHRIADRRVIRLIEKRLKAGVLEDGKKRTGSARLVPYRAAASSILVVGEYLSS